LLVVRALPGTPPHDGIRLILPAFGFWCVLAGVGAQAAWNGVASSRRPVVWRRTMVAAGAVCAATSVMNVVRYYPQTLSHYSWIVGGLRGAARIGMEPTYWWDALDADVLTWLASHTDSQEAIAFSEISEDNVRLLGEWGQMPLGVVEPDWGVPFKWYVLQNRPGLLDATDRTLIRRETPAYVKYPGHHQRAVPDDLHVPLILIFSSDQYRRAVRATTGQ
jgi:hypothetical protein